MKTKRKIFSTGLLMIFAISMTAQKGIDDGSKYGHGQDSIDCRMNASLFYEAAKQKSYADALEPWTHCYENCPASTKNIYIYGLRIIGYQYKTAKTKEDKKKYFDKLMEIYDMRIKYFGNDRKYPAAYILGEKATMMYNLKKGDLASQKKVYEWYKESISKLGTKSKTANLQNYMVVNFDLYNISELSIDDLFNNYIDVQEVLEAQQANEDDPKIKDLLSQILDNNTTAMAKTGALSCETLDEQFGPKVEENKENLEGLNKVLKLYETTGCEESESYFKISEYIHAIKPSAGSAAGIAAGYLKRDDIESAFKFYNAAISLEEDPVKKAKYLHTIALLQFTKKNDYPKARQYARMAIKENPNWGAPYMLIGDLYAQSAQKQQLGKKDIENQAGYWAAVDKYAQAKKVDAGVAEKASNMIKLYSNYFPNKEAIFFEPDYEAGKIVTVGGWINEKTLVRAKE